LEYECNNKQKQNQLQIEGTIEISKNLLGQLIIKTLLGNIIEDAPTVMKEGKLLNAEWIIKNNIVTFDIKGIEAPKSFTIPTNQAMFMFAGTV
jgi:hypothetical protein